MTFEEAVIDAARTVRRWRDKRYSGSNIQRIRRHVACVLHCYPEWNAIKAEITRRLLDEGADPTPSAALLLQ